MPGEDTKLAVMANDITYIKGQVAEIKANTSTQLVSRTEFTPVRNLVYGLVGLILIAVVGALLALVVRK